MARRGQQQSQRGMMLLIFLLPKIIMLLYSIIRHGIKHAWIFPVSGLIIAYLIHYHTPHLHTALHIIFYIALIGVGIPLTIWKLNWNKRKASELYIFTNPDMPDDLYENEIE